MYFMKNIVGKNQRLMTRFQKAEKNHPDGWTYGMPIGESFNTFSLRRLQGITSPMASWGDWWYLTCLFRRRWAGPWSLWGFSVVMSGYVCCKSRRWGGAWYLKCRVFWVNNGSYWEPSPYAQLARMVFSHGGLFFLKLETHTDWKATDGSSRRKGQVLAHDQKSFGMASIILQQLGIPRVRDDSSSSSWTFQTVHIRAFLWGSWLLVFSKHLVSPNMDGLTISNNYSV